MLDQGAASFDRAASRPLADRFGRTPGESRLLTTMVDRTDDTTADIRMSQAGLAALAGLSRRTVIRMLYSMDDGLLTERKVGRKRCLTWVTCEHRVPRVMCDICNAMTTGHDLDVTYPDEMSHVTIQRLNVTHNAEPTEQMSHHLFGLTRRPSGLTKKRALKDGETFQLSQPDSTTAIGDLQQPTSTPWTGPGASPATGAESVEPTASAERLGYAHPPTSAGASSVSAYDAVLDKLDRVRRSGNTAIASCPVTSHGKGNGDREPSLSIAINEGKVLLNCMSGCHVQDVMIAIGIDWADLFEEPITNDRGVKVAEWTYQRSDGTPHMIAERWQTPRGKRFVQRIPGADRTGLPSGFQPALYQLPKVLAAVAAGEEIFVVEGEKGVAAAQHLGVVATTAPGGASKHWENYYAKWLRGASRVTVVADNDEPGLRHAAEIVASMRMNEIPVRAVRGAVSTDKADLYDHVLAGFGLADLRPVRLNRLHPSGTSLSNLLNGEYPATKWVIPNLLPVGLTMLGGAPKVGKSMIALDIALAVAHGGYALYGPKCNQGSVLYLSLDNDDESTLSARARHLSGRVGYPNEGPMEILTEYPVGRDAIAAISEWVEMERDENREPLFVVADTLARIEPEYEGTANDRSLYSGATAAMARWSALADKAQIGIMFVHHSHKAGERGKGSDWMNLFMGSQGLAAGCKNLMMVQHERGTDSAYLFTDSRHCDGQELKLNRDGWGWAMFDQIRTRPNVPGKAGLRVVQGGKE
jgi:hypothetical protein